MHISGELSLGAPFQDAIIGLIGKKHIPFSIASGPFGKLETIGQFLNGFTRGDDLAFGARQRMDAEDQGKKKRREFHKGSEEQTGAGVKFNVTEGGFRGAAE